MFGGGSWLFAQRAHFCGYGRGNFACVGLVISKKGVR